MEGGELAAVLVADEPQDQLGVGPDLAGRSAGSPAVAWWAEGLAGRIVGDLADLGGVVIEDVAAGHHGASCW
jgi:hypothetical protein